MGYVTYIFSLFYGIAYKIKIPIPISENNVFYLSIYSIFIGMIVLGLIIWFIAKLLNFEINWSFKQLGRYQDNYFNTKEDFKQTPLDISKRTRKGDPINKIRWGTPWRKADARRKDLYN